MGTRKRPRREKHEQVEGAGSIYKHSAEEGEEGRGDKAAPETGEDDAITGVLSDDTIIHILRHFPARFLLSSPALVCRRWRRLSSDAVLELVPSPLSSYKPHWGPLGEREVLELGRRYCTTLEKVNLFGLLQLKNEQIVSLLKSLPKLKNFAVFACHMAKSEIEDLINALPRDLITLDLHYDHLLASNCGDCFNPQQSNISCCIQLLQRNCPTLQNLNLDFCTNISVECWDSLLLAAPNFRSLNLHSHMLGWSEVSKVLQSCPRLEYLSIVSARLCEQNSCDSDEEEHTFRRQPGLRTRTTLFTSGSEPCNIASLVPASLCSIRLYSSPHYSVPLDTTPLFGLLKDKGRQLQHLHAESLFNTSWHVVSVWCANLKTLDLSHARAKAYVATGIEEVVLCGLPQLLKHLERLALPTVTDRILVNLGRFCPKLKEIHFEGFGADSMVVHTRITVTDRGVVALAEGCPNLQVISLAGCVAVTVHSLRCLAFHCRNLKALLLPGCTKIDEEAMVAVYPRFGKSLLVLDLTGCKITSKTIRNLCQHFQMHGTSLAVLAISRSLWRSSKSELSKLSKWIRTIRVLSGSSGLPWDGFYGSQGCILG